MKSLKNLALVFAAALITLGANAQASTKSSDKSAKPAATKTQNSKSTTKPADSKKPAGKSTTAPAKSGK